VTALLVTEAQDVLEIQRHEKSRSSIYVQKVPLVRARIVEIVERLDAQGRVVDPLQARRAARARSLN
jgi:hypothetical protein